MNSSGTLKIARNGYIVMAVVFCALGIFLMVNPTKAMKIICVLAGILFIADGIIKIIGYFSRDFYCLAFQFDLGFGILMIAVGILILVRREAILRLIFVIFGLVILTDALLRIQMSVEAKKFGLKLWWAVLLIAVATGIFGKSSINSVAKWDGLVFGDWRLFAAQIEGIAITILIAVVGTLICVGIVRIFTPLRVTLREEQIGLDITQHGESAYPTFNGMDQ